MYESPTINELGSFAELTLDTIHKQLGGMDTIVYSNGSIQIPGHGATIS